MREKTIEKMPYLTLPKTLGKKVKYVAVTAYKIIGHKRHLFVEVYKNSRKSKEIPIARIVINQREVKTYITEPGYWTAKRIDHTVFRGDLIWQEGDTYCSPDDLAKENLCFSQEDVKRIRDYLSAYDKAFHKSSWWSLIIRHQTKTLSDKRYKAWESKQKRRQEGLRIRAEATPELDEEALKDWANNTIFMNRHFLYYKKRGRFTELCCSACGNISTGTWKPRDCYEGNFEKYINPTNGHHGICPLCKAKGQYKQQGKAKGIFELSTYFFKADKAQFENGPVPLIRYIKATKRYELKSIVLDDDIHMLSARESIGLVEVARQYFKDDRIQRDYHKHDNWLNKDFWDDCNLAGIGNISIEDGYVYKGFEESLKETKLQYSGIESYPTKVNAFRYLEAFKKMPQLEMITKLGLTELTDSLMFGNQLVKSLSAKRLDEFLGIRKERVKFLIQHRGNKSIVKILQAEELGKIKLSERDIEELAEHSLTTDDILYLTRLTSIRKILKYTRTKDMQMYIDYLRLRDQLGYDLTNTIYLFPRDLWTAHDRMVYEANKEKFDKRLKEVEVKYPLIKQNYKKINEKYHFEDDEFVIRPAKAAPEIVEEGRILHHCVGGDNYLSSHNTGKSYILFLRKKKHPKTPFITVEITDDFTIRQWYGAYDKKPDEKRIQEWIDSYVRFEKGKVS